MRISSGALFSIPNCEIDMHIMFQAEVDGDISLTIKLGRKM